MVVGISGGSLSCLAPCVWLYSLESLRILPWCPGKALYALPSTVRGQPTGRRGHRGMDQVTPWADRSQPSSPGLDDTETSQCDWHVGKTAQSCPAPMSVQCLPGWPPPPHPDSSWSSRRLPRRPHGASSPDCPCSDFCFSGSVILIFLCGQFWLVTSIVTNNSCTFFFFFSCTVEIKRMFL